MGPLSFSVRADLLRIVSRFTAREALALQAAPGLAGVRIAPAQHGVALSACNGLVALFVYDAGGRASRPCVMQRPENGLGVVRDAARGRVGEIGDGPARLVFHDGHCIIDADPTRELILSELVDDHPSLTQRMPARALRAAVSFPADVGEALSVTARQLASAAGADAELARFARFSAYRSAANDGLVEDDAFIIVRFAQSPAGAFALIAPDGAVDTPAPPVWQAPAWLSDAAAKPARVQRPRHWGA